MPRHFNPDSYNGFRNDRERRIALNARARYMALACVVWAPPDSRWVGTIVEIIGRVLGLFR
jgi:hypothetical protein